MIWAIFIISILAWLGGLIKTYQTGKSSVLETGAIAILSSWYLYTPLGITLLCVIVVITLIVIAVSD